MSKKKSYLTPEERALFKKTQQGTQRLHTDKHLLKKKPLSTRSNPKPSPELLSHCPVDSAAIYLENLAPEDWRKPDDTIHFAQVGVQQRTLMKLKKGQLPLEAQLDLHRATANEALASCENFFEACRHHQRRVVLVVHGKGQISAQRGPVLKNLLNQWLREQPYVLAFYSAKPKHGGTGAMYILLKRQSHEK